MQKLFAVTVVLGLMLTAAPAFSQSDQYREPHRVGGPGSYPSYPERSHAQQPYMEFSTHPQGHQHQKPYMEFDSHPQGHQHHQDPYMEFQSR